MQTRMIHITGKKKKKKVRIGMVSWRILLRCLQYNNRVVCVLPVHWDMMHWICARADTALHKHIVVHDAMLHKH